MLSGLQPDDTHPDPWAEIDDLLEVERWGTPMSRRVAPRPELPPEEAWAPSWWKGDEDASQSFLRSMGVHLT